MLSLKVLGENLPHGFLSASGVAGNLWCFSTMWTQHPNPCFRHHMECSCLLPSRADTSHTGSDPSSFHLISPSVDCISRNLGLSQVLGLGNFNISFLKDFIYFYLFIFKTFIYLAVRGLSCGMQELVPWPGKEHKSLVWGAQESPQHTFERTPFYPEHRSLLQPYLFSAETVIRHLLFPFEWQAAVSYAWGRQETRKV